MIVDYTTKGGKPIVHEVKREDGERIQLDTGQLEPYFYVHQNERVKESDYDEIVRIEEGDWLSARGEPLKKIVVEHPKQVGGYNGIRSEFDETWESDIYFRTRYWIDMVDIEEFEPPNYRIFMYDIEVDHSLDASNAPEPIISISGYDNYQNKYVTFLLEPEDRNVEGYKEEDHSLYVFSPSDYAGDEVFDAKQKAERDMLMKFIDFIKMLEPDIVAGWNSEGYDDPYLFNRMKNMRIDYSEISPIQNVNIHGSDDGDRVKVKGREFIDMYRAFQKVYFSDLESYKLNDVGASLLDLEKVKFTTSISQLWRDDPEKLVEYNVRDVEIMVKLDRAFNVWDTMRAVQGFVGINLSDILSSSRTTQGYLLRRMERKLPRQGWSDDYSSYQGADVLEETPGVSRNVAVLDLKSQYPSAMISFNMSPETKVESPEVTDKDTIAVGNGAVFEYEEQGIVPQILLELNEERDREKALRDDCEPGTEEYQRHDVRQAALKVIMNSIYGVIGYEKFSLYDREIASATTYVGRDSLGWAVDKAEELGYTVIYGDTDSVMISMGEEVDLETAKDKAKKLEKFINESYDEYAEQKGVDLTRFGMDEKHFFEIEFEKLYEGFFQQQAQKKYGAKVRWKEGNWVEKWDFAQYGKKSDMAELSRELQVDLVQMIIEGADKSEVQSFITDVCNGIKNEEYSFHKIGIPSKMKKAPDEYETDRPVIRAIKYANEYMDESFAPGDKPKLLYVKRTPPGLPDTDVICFSQVTPPDGFIVDYDTMVDKVVRQKVRRILRVMDWSWDSMYRKSANLLDI